MIIEQAIDNLLGREEIRKKEAMDRLNMERIFGAKQFKKTKAKQKMARASRRRNRE